MTTPHDERDFQRRQRLGQADSSPTPRSMSLDDDGFLEALLADTEVKFVDKAKKARLVKFPQVLMTALLSTVQVAGSGETKPKATAKKKSAKKEAPSEAD